jgi:hypothetical protein
MMLEPTSLAGTRFIVLVLQVHMSYPKTEIFDREEPARERWREAADAVVTGAPINDHLVTWARLYIGPAVGSKRDALRLASAGHLKLLETSHPADAPGRSKKRTRSGPLAWPRANNLPT